MDPKYDEWKWAESRRTRVWAQYWRMVDETTEEEFLAGDIPRPPVDQEVLTA